MQRKKIAFVFTCLAFSVAVGFKSDFPRTTAFAEGDLTVLEQQVLGQKYPDDKPEARVQRLEGALKATNAPSSSLEYRKDRLYRLEESAVEARKKQSAILAYNEGVDNSTKGDTAGAISAYQKAIRLDPNLVQAYNNLANLLLQNNQYDETVQLYKQAIAMRPQDPLLHRNLGVLYEKLGKVQDSISEYETYLKYTQQPDPPIQSIVANYQANRAAGAGAPDYFSATTQSSQGQTLIWLAQNNPVRVFVKPTETNQLAVLPIIQESLDGWQQVLAGRLKFRQVMNPDEANIIIELRRGPLTDPIAHIGRTEYHMPEEQLLEHRLNFVTITLNTGEGETSQQEADKSRREQIYRMALHEVGHAIGIWGHSPDPGDIMFAHPIASHLSNRDIRTVRKLYGI
jgi:predicted Zn-dependent protease